MVMADPTDLGHGKKKRMLLVFSATRKCMLLVFRATGKPVKVSPAIKHDILILKPFTDQKIKTTYYT